MGILDFLKRPRHADHPNRKASLRGRSQVYNILDNIIGFDDDRVTSGEALGAKLRSDPFGAVGGAVKAVGADLDDLMFQGGAMERPEDVFGYAGGVAGGTALRAGRGILDYDPNTTRIFLGPKAQGADMAGIRAFQGSPHNFAAERLVQMPDGSAQYIVGAPDVLPDVPAGATVLQDFPLGRMRMDKIGTGEGAQAYGHGLYVAEAEDVARGYRDALKMKGYDNNPIYNEAVSQHGFGAKEFDQFESLARQTIHDPDLLARAFFDWNDEWRPLANDPAEFKNVRDFAEKYIKSAPRGSMYEVNINANPEDFLDWDAPLSAQPESVRLLAERAGVVDVAPEWRFNGYDGGYFRKTENGSVRVGQVRHLGGKQYRAMFGRDDLGTFSSPDQARRAIDKALEARGGASEALKMRGSDLYSRIAGGIDSLVSEPTNRVGATSKMSQAGIPGIKYLDAGSRGSEGGTRNFVVFDENLISIVRKYGIAGAAAMLGVSVMDVEQAMAQGAPQPQPQGLLGGAR